MRGPPILDRVKMTLDSVGTISILAEDVLCGNYSEIHKPSIFSRALVWKLLAMRLNKINKQEGHEEMELNLSNLAKLRRDYDILAAEFDVPWHELSQQSEYYQALTAIDDGFDISDDLSKKQKISRMRVIHDPLSTRNTENRIASQETDLQMLEAIIADVDRLFPEFPRYFIQNLRNRQQLTKVLFLWCKLNAVSYFQGLHEICGLIYVVFYSDCIPRSSSKASKLHTNRLDKQILSLMDLQFLSHDTFSVFNIMMKPIMAKYYSESALLQETIMFDLKLHQSDKFLYHLFKNKFRLDSRIWLMRYFRLLLIREIGLVQSVRLWDRLIAFSFLEDPFKADLDITLLLPYIVLIMLSIIKKRLIISDYGDALYLLLHYPVKNDACIHPSVICKDSIILINNDDSEDEDDKAPQYVTNDCDFTYIEQNHQRQRLSESSRSSDHSGSDADSDENVQLHINKITRDAVLLYRMNDSELEADGGKLLEAYSAMHNQEDKKGRISTGAKLSSSPFIEEMLKRTSSWSHPGRKNVKILSTDFERMTIQPEEMQPKTNNRDFDRTRLEMRLQKKVKDALKK
ncbi:hypothetical protein FOA43_004769 [Brettanomyces nanus]|uniref:Rab-GAP TBC domain-containing protein n=1 Tax=Eeniella nana TaxID=13502 RepID=A0A875RYK4_EENNA|nr:uncharacterized protein FOA43_004769 [Brettanomyces nanus]QPG77357.1 hypothetical protein FOA43_004769 [Brettanomyces nanus]